MPSKSDLRVRMKAARADLASAAPDFGDRVAALFFRSIRLAPGVCVAGYWPMRSEADDLPLLAACAARGHAISLPCLNGSAPLVFRRWRPGGPLVSAAHGLKEPPKGGDEVFPDLIFVPLLAFDSAGHRLGYGGGYYDRTLAALRARSKVVAVGIAFAGQKVACLMPEAHDERLDAVLSEQGLDWFGAAPSGAIELETE